MSWEPKRAIARVLAPDGGTAGTAFFVAPDLLATCAHVLSGDAVEVELAGAVVPARVVARRAPEAEDLALLRVGAPGAPLVLAPLVDGRRRHRSWGFPAVKAVEGMAATVTELAPAMDAGVPALQARSEEVSLGFSGAPVWDDETDAVIGVVMGIASGDPGERQATTFFIRPVEELWNLLPALRETPENPYRGLDVFEAEHAALYFGRERAIAALTKRLVERDFVTVVGPSGSGKSSLVRAGLAKALAKHAPLELEGRPRIVFRPGAVPSADLERATAALDGPAIVIVDQFERVFTDGAGEDERARFAGALLALAGYDAKVVLTLRADFYGQALSMPALAAAVDAGQVTVLPMTRDELLSAVVEPARARLRALEPGLAEQLVDDVVGRPGDLPLLQLALTELWTADAASGVLRRATYEALGAHDADGEPLRVRGVIARLAEQRWQVLDAAGQAAARRLLLTLVAPAVHGGASRRAWQGESDAAMQAVAAQLVDARLLTTGVDAATGRPTVEVAHEALIWAWPRLRSLATQHEEFIRFFAADLAPFLRRGADDAPLRGEALKRAEGWLATAPELFSRPAAEFVVASVARRDAEAEAERAHRHALRLSESLRLASEAREALTAEPDVALLVAWEALLRDRNVLSEAVFRDALDRLPAPVALLRPAGGEAAEIGFLADGTIYAASPRRGELGLWDADGRPTGSIAVPGAGKLSVAACGTRLLTFRGTALRLHERDGGVVAELELPDAHPDMWQGIAVADDGTCLVHVERRCWLVRIGRDTLVSERELELVAESIDDETRHAWGASLRRVHLGETIVTEGGDDVRVWTRDGAPIGVIDPRSIPMSAALAHDGSVLVTGIDGEGLVWDPVTGSAAVFRDPEASRYLSIEALDPRGHYVITRTSDVAGVAVRLTSGELLAEILGSGAEIISAAFSADGTRVAAGDRAGVVRVADLREEHGELALTGHRERVCAVAFGPEKPLVLVTADEAGEVRMWRLDEPAEAPRDDAPPMRDEGFEIAPGGRHIAGVDGSRVKLWEASSRREICDAVGADAPGVREPHAVVAGLGFRADGSRLAVASRNGTVWIWDVGGALVARFLADHSSPDRIFAFASDPRGELIAIGIRHEAVLWSWDGERVGAVRVHGSKVRRVAFLAGGDRILTIADDAHGPSAPVELFARDGERVALLDARDVSTSAVPRGDTLGRYFCLADGPRVAIFDTGGERLATIAGAAGTRARRTALSPDGGLVAVAGSDGLARLWSYDERRIVMTLRVGESEGLAFSRDGRELLCETGSGAIGRFPLDVADLFEAARTRMARPLTAEELERFGIEAPELDL